MQLTNQAQPKPVFQCKQKYSILFLNTAFDILFILVILYISSWSIEIGLAFLCIWILLKIISWLIYRATFTFDGDGITIKSLSQYIHIRWEDITSVTEIRTEIRSSSHIVIVSPKFPKRQYIAGIWLRGFRVSPVFAIWKYAHTNYSSAQELLSVKVKDKYEVKKRVI